jgi:hypothetical protein
MTNQKKESRIKIEDLPQEEKELSADEQKQVQGGATRAVTPGIRTGGTNAVAEDTETTDSSVANMFTKI